MRYTVLIYADERALSTMSRDEGMAMMSAYFAYTNELRAAGVLIAGEPLEHSGTATSIRTRGGHNEVVDGPFAETKEQLGGFYLLDVADADEAIRWAARCPGVAHGTIEVRPVMELPVSA